MFWQTLSSVHPDFGCWFKKKKENSQSRILISYLDVLLSYKLQKYNNKNYENLCDLTQFI